MENWTNGGSTPVLIRHYTDPTCPFAFSAERQRLRLEWLYGEHIRWELRMVVLGEEPNPALTPEAVSKSRRKLQLHYGMPIDWRPVEIGPSIAACRAVVAARLHAPEYEHALLRRMRVLHFASLDLDAETIDRAGSEIGIGPGDLHEWLESPRVEDVLRADMKAARSPSPASRAQNYKLGGPDHERRYTCPSYELIRVTEPPPDWHTAHRVDLPGYRPIEAYETALANLAPELDRRPDPESVQEVLEWAAIPVATVEVAAVCDREVADVRTELARVAEFTPVGGDGYWAL